jgi:hypothetical protein
MSDLHSNPLLHLNNANRNASSFVGIARDPRPPRTRTECDRELLDFLVEKTLQSFMPLAVVPPVRPPHKRPRKKRPHPVA